MTRNKKDIVKFQRRNIEWGTLREKFIEAARQGDVDTLSGVVREYPEAPSTWRSGDVVPALVLAAQNGRLEAVQYLIEQCGMTPGVPENEDLSALVGAAFYGHADIVDYLLQQGADINEAEAPGSRNTALYWAAHNGHYATAKLLLERTADTRPKGDSGKTAREAAIAKHHPEIAELIDKLDMRVHLYKSGSEERIRVSAPLSFRMK